MKLQLPKRTQDLARVRIVDPPQSDSGPNQPVSSKQTAELELPREELERMWRPEYLERLARTYWAYLTRISLGILRVVYGEDCREIVVFRRPFVLLRFHGPEYDTNANGGTVTWRIDKGLLVAPKGRGKDGFLRITVEREESEDANDEVITRVSSEVTNFYPMIGGWGWFGKIGRWIYRVTQLRIHVIVTHGFLRSLAKLELEESKVGKLLEDGTPAGEPSAAD
ncbi:MAG: hypothetical protein H0V29_02925 [Thermoleophilaceae bacterium]|nr:hypothetical protein [Thermoleophilaceae bacterium]